MTTITVTFDPPLPSDSPATFNSKAFDTLGDLNTWSGQANTVAGEVNTNATNAATSAGTASTHASTATTQAGIATTQAGIATTQAGLATTNGAAQVALAAAQVSLATTQANTATTQAGTATTKASEADASAIAAAASAASIAPGSLLTAANPSYTGTLTGGTGVVNLGSGQLVKDTSGNLGLGVVPSAWGGGKGFQVEKASVFGAASLGGFASNLYLADAGANYRCIANGTVALYLQNVAGDHRWSVGSGTAGNIVSPTTGMTLDASGALRVQEVGNSNGTMQLGGTTYYGTIKHDASSTGANIYNVASASGGGHIFQRDGTTQFMTDGSGNLLVGTAVALGGERLNVTGNVANNISRIYNTNASPYGLYMAYTQNVSGTSNEFLDFRTNGSTQKFVVYSDGNTRIAAGSTYGNISDRKLKDNITDASPKLADVMRLKVRNFTVKDDPSQIKFIGWIAQEFEEVFPGLVSKTEDTEEVKKAREIEVSAVDAVLDDEGNEVTPAVEATTRTEEYTERVPTGTFTKGIKESALIPILTKALQEQQAQIEAMQAQLDDQNTAMQLLASRLAALEAAWTPHKSK